MGARIKALPALTLHLHLQVSEAINRVGAYCEIILSLILDSFGELAPSLVTKVLLQRLQSVANNL